MLSVAIEYWIFEHRIYAYNAYVRSGENLSESINSFDSNLILAITGHTFQGVQFYSVRDYWECDKEDTTRIIKDSINFQKH